MFNLALGNKVLLPSSFPKQLGSRPWSSWLLLFPPFFFYSSPCKKCFIIYVHGNRHQRPAKMAAASYARHVGVAFALSWFWGEASDVFTVPYSTQSCHRCHWPRLRLRVVFISAIRSLLHCPWRAREPAFLQLVCGPASPTRNSRD